MDDKDPLSGLWGAVIKFVCATLFGGLLSFVFFLEVLDWDFDFFLEKPWIHVFWIIPLVCGVIGVFCFEQTLDSSGGIFEDYFDL